MFRGISSGVKWLSKKSAILDIISTKFILFTFSYLWEPFEVKFQKCMDYCDSMETQIEVFKEEFILVWAKCLSNVLFKNWD